MTDLILAGSISRADPLPTTALPINSGGNVRVVSYDPGGVTKVRGVAKSPSIEGGIQTYSKKDMRSIALTLRFYGTTKAALDAVIADYLDAFNQSLYQLTVTLDDATVVWQCNDADCQPITSSGGTGADMFGLMVAPRLQAYAFTIPALPTPVSGVY